MTTENEVEVRDINELLLLDTYQGMTDEEIETIIEYKARRMFNEREHQMRINATLQAANAQTAAMQALEDDANSVLKSLVSYHVPMITFGDES